MKNHWLRVTLLAGAASFVLLPIINQQFTAAAAGPTAADPLLAGFQSPPQGARPRVWWHWMNGNVTKDGIAKDIAWMKRVGIGGLQNFDANLMTPKVVDKRLVYMTPEWRDAFRFAASEAEQAGLELAIAASPGWSETGGPWVPPADGMKKLVWSELAVPGGVRFGGKLPALPSTTGPYQEIGGSDALAGLMGAEAAKPPSFYADVAVLALPMSAAGGATAAEFSGTDGQALAAAALTDDNRATAVKVPREAVTGTATVTARYASPQTLRSARSFVLKGASMFGDPALSLSLQARVGNDWQTVAEWASDHVPTTVSFAPVAAREFRLLMEPYRGAPRPGLGEGAPGAVPFDLFGGGPATAPVELAELQLSRDPQIDRAEAKAGFSVAMDYYALTSNAAADDVGVAAAAVVDLTAKLSADGTLDWTPPPGRWRILRLGYSLIGTTNHPATPEATGLEVDKYDGAAVRRYLEHYLATYRETTGAALFGAKGLRALLTDSIEVGPSNWTPNMVAQFQKLRGYDPRPWLPALTGLLIGTRAQSDAFLYDYRRTLADLVASEHYGMVAEVAHQHGLKVYGEALEDARPILGDDMAMRAHADVPMAAMWAYNRGSNVRPTLLGDMKGAASVAHIYGQNVVAAESLTASRSPWAFAPYDLRRLIDLEFAMGVNRPVIHTSVHQPLDDKQPGFSLMIFGQYFNRHETWAEMARPWVDYIARNDFLLQQGRNVADVAYFYGEEQPITALTAHAALPDQPRRYAYDYVNVDVLQNRLQVQGKDLVAKTGARYRVLYLGGTSQRMTLPVLRRIAALVEAGATVAGAAPQGSPSLKDDPGEFQALVKRLWGSGAGGIVGRGRVIGGQDVEAALASMNVTPDFSYAGAGKDAELLFVHRGLSDGDLYFVSNRANTAQQVEARFRANGRAPEIWRAESGQVEPVSYRIANGQAIVPLNLGPEESLFVVFRKAASAAALTVPARHLQRVAAIDGGWKVSFQPGRGAPASASFATLHSLADDADAGIRYFSGTSSYSREIDVPAGGAAGAPLWLDLGRIGDVAEVHVNGKSAGVSWWPPYRVDIGGLVRPGANHLEVRVANLWVNRLIGDAQPGAQKFTFTTLPTYQASAPLRPAGLIGPVTLWREAH
jgi:alpha-L-rhamnosidase